MPSQATRNSGSPLTPLNSSFNSPAKLDDEVISISDSDSEGNALGHVMRPNLAYVQVPASSSLRKRSKSGSSVVRSVCHRHFAGRVFSNIDLPGEGFA